MIMRSGNARSSADSVDTAWAEAAEPPPGPEWAQRLPGAAQAPLYLTGRCRRQLTVLPRPAVRTR
jgi:hypothetical protein